MSEWACWLLGYPGIQAAIERHELTVDQVAAAESPPVSGSDLLGVNKYLYFGQMKLAQAIKLKSADFKDLTLPTVQHYLDTGKMTMSQMLALKSATRRKLT